MNKWRYLSRVLPAYSGARSHLSFWHETPEINGFEQETLGPYYMKFREKAAYPAPFDETGVPLLDYRGRIGRQYNPIAIAQYGLAHYNLWKAKGEARSKDIFRKQADWLVDHLEPNTAGLRVWMHKFDWEYRERLKNPWYSGLAQGQGISLLLRAYLEFSNESYLEAAKGAFTSLTRETSQGGVLYRDKRGDPWIEEYIVDPPSHILNGFIWALWGVYDYWLVTQDCSAKDLFDRSVRTLVRNLKNYDTGFWSTYDNTRKFFPNLASPYYHSLHIAQLKIMHQLTGETVFSDHATQWENYLSNPFHRIRALSEKAAFKLLYY